MRPMKRLGDRLPDVAAGARDKGHFSGEALHSVHHSTVPYRGAGDGETDWTGRTSWSLYCN